MQTSRTTNIIKRGIWYAALASVWLLTLVLALEAGSFLLRIYEERSNPFIAARRAGLQLPVPETPAVLVSVDGYYPQHPGGWHQGNAGFDDDIAMQKILEWGPRDLALSAAEQRKRRYAFPNFPEHAREAYALTQGEAVLVVDSQHRIRKAYGAYTALFSGVQGTFLDYALRWADAARPLHRAIRKTRQHDNTTTRQHDNTTTRQHDNTTRNTDCNFCYTDESTHTADHMRSRSAHDRQ